MSHTQPRVFHGGQGGGGGLFRSSLGKYSCTVRLSTSSNSVLGEGQPSPVLACAEVTLAIHTVFWAGTGYVLLGPAFCPLRSAHESVFP